MMMQLLYFAEMSKDNQRNALKAADMTRLAQIARTATESKRRAGPSRQARRFRRLRQALSEATAEDACVWEGTCA